LPIAAGLALLALVGCNQVDTRTPVERFGLAETPAGRPTATEAIEMANAMLATKSPVRLRGSWQSRAGGESGTDVPVYLIDGNGISAVYVVIVPIRCLCIFVQPGAFRQWVKDHTERLRQMVSTDPAAILAFMLLHEVGHIEHGDPGQFEAEGGAVAINTDPTVQKDRETAADRFAVDMVEAANANLSSVDGWLASIKVMTALTALSWNMSAIRLVENFGATSLCSRAVFADSGYSHPNFELRLLVANNLLAPTPASLELVDTFMNCRLRRNPGILFQRRN
jgi:hypothetical protein